MIPEDCTTAILEVLRRYRKDESSAVSVEDEAAHLDRMARCGWADALPNRQRRGSWTSADELQKLHDKCFSLYEHVAEMHADALAALKSEIGENLYYSSFMKELGKLSDAAWRARCAVDDAPQRKLPKGSQSKMAQNFIIDAARTYEKITGRIPARSFNKLKKAESGEFVGFIEALFTAVGIKAKAAGQVRIFIDKKNSGTLPESRNFRL